VDTSTVATFNLVAVQCQFERKYRRSHDTATEEELDEFSFPYVLRL
jgi:hypothetical protein